MTADKDKRENLKKLSLDERKRLEYEVREKAIRDHNSQMKSAERRGETRGIAIGTKSTLERFVKVNLESGKSMEEIAEFLKMNLSEVEKLSEK